MKATPIYLTRTQMRVVEKAMDNHVARIYKAKANTLKGKEAMRESLALMNQEIVIRLGALGETITGAHACSFILLGESRK